MSHQAVLFHAGFRNLLGVLIGDTLAAFVIVFGVFGGPPIVQIALVVKLAPLVVKAVSDFVPDDRAFSAKVCGVIGVREKKGGCKIPAGKLMVLNCGS